MRSNRCLAKGFLTGMVGGLVASWAMNQFWTLQSKLKEQPGDQKGEQSENDQQQRASDNPTTKVAEAIARPLLHRGLSDSEKTTGGSIVHYAFGALSGGIYGLLSEATPAARAGFGLAYATALWLAADEGIVPALKLSPPPQESTLSEHLSGLGAHLVYGATTEAVRRTLRAAA